MEFGYMLHKTTLTTGHCLTDSVWASPKIMHSLGINGEENWGQLSNQGLCVNVAVKMVCMCACMYHCRNVSIITAAFAHYMSSQHT